MTQIDGEPSTGKQTTPGRVSRPDLVVGTLVMALGVFALAEALGLPFTFNGAPGPALFPTLLSALLVVLGALLSVDAVRKRNVHRASEARAPVEPAEAAATNPAEEVSGASGRRDLTRVASVAGGWMASIVVIGRLGFVPTMILLVLYIAFVIEKKRGWRPLLVALLIPIAAYIVFGRFLQIKVPVGPLGY
jgi:putative tricarboxylic transport membrane protein